MSRGPSVLRAAEALRQLAAPLPPSVLLDAGSMRENSLADSFVLFVGSMTAIVTTLFRAICDECGCSGNRLCRTVVASVSPAAADAANQHWSNCVRYSDRWLPEEVSSIHILVIGIHDKASAAGARRLEVTTDNLPYQDRSQTPDVTPSHLRLGPFSVISHEEAITLPGRTGQDRSANGVLALGLSRLHSGNETSRALL